MRVWERWPGQWWYMCACAEVGTADYDRVIEMCHQHQQLCTKAGPIEVVKVHLA